MSKYQATSAAPADHPGPIKVIRENSPNFFYDGKPPAARTERRFKQGGIFQYSILDASYTKIRFRLRSEYMFMFTD